ncbi:hypothetical protein GOP47_0030173 [Adiantum capillus-veneris]|nr:hypothetical protein GOP47_0030173 [Adiantum capillus-veneris]
METYTHPHLKWSVGCEYAKDQIFSNIRHFWLINIKGWKVWGHSGLVNQNGQKKLIVEGRRGNSSLASLVLIIISNHPKEHPTLPIYSMYNSMILTLCNRMLNFSKFEKVKSIY